MATPEIDFSELAERVRRLEIQNRRWKLASFLLLSVFGSLLATSLVAQEKAEPVLVRAKTVEAQSFTLEDADGKIRGQISMSANSPTLELYDKTGRIVWPTSRRSDLTPSR